MVSSRLIPSRPKRAMAAPASSEVPAVDEPEPPKVKISDDHPDMRCLIPWTKLGFESENVDSIGALTILISFNGEWALNKILASHRVRGTFSRSMPTAIAIAYLRSFVKSLGFEPVDQVACTTQTIQVDQSSPLSPAEFDKFRWRKRMLKGLSENCESRPRGHEDEDQGEDPGAISLRLKACSLSRSWGKTNLDLM